MKNSGDIGWAKRMAEIFVENLTVEEIQHLIKTNYQLPVVGDKRKANSRSGLWPLGIIKAENAAVDVLNAYYTNLLYTELKKHFTVHDQIHRT